MNAVHTCFIYVRKGNPYVVICDSSPKQGRVASPTVAQSRSCRANHQTQL